MARIDEKRLNAFIDGIAEIRAACERKKGGVSCNYVFLSTDGRVPPHAPAKVVFAIEVVPPGCFLPDPPADIILPARVVLHQPVQFRYTDTRVGITLKRRYVEYCRPAVEIMPPAQYCAAPEPPDRTAETTDFKVVKRDAFKDFPAQEEWAREERQAQAAALAESGVRFLSNEESAAIMREAERSFEVEEAASVSMPPPAASIPPVATPMRQLDPHAPIRFGGKR
jgi:hypothetical protein